MRIALAASKAVLLGIALALCCIPLQAQISTNRTASAEPTKTCFKCNGTGKMKCPDCKSGYRNCPGPCLKLSRGIWEHLDVPGHDKSELWQRFYSPDGSWQAWNQHHVGEVIEIQDGKAVDIGKCKICGGTGLVKCSTCQGTGIVTCDICDGKGMIPHLWTSFDNPKLKNRPGSIHLKDGRTIFGKVTISTESAFWIKLESGETIRVGREEVEDGPQKAGSR
jgi:hypothetical protein